MAIDGRQRSVIERFPFAKGKSKQKPWLMGGSVVPLGRAAFIPPGAVTEKVTNAPVGKLHRLFYWPALLYFWQFSKRSPIHSSIYCALHTTFPLFKLLTLSSFINVGSAQKKNSIVAHFHSGIEAGWIGHWNL